MQVCRHVRAVAEACVSSASVRVHQCVCVACLVKRAARLASSVRGITPPPSLLFLSTQTIRIACLIGKYRLSGW